MGKQGVKKPKTVRKEEKNKIKAERNDKKQGEDPFGRRR